MGTIQTFYWPLKRNFVYRRFQCQYYIAPRSVYSCYMLLSILTIKQGVIGVRQLQPENKTKPLFFFFSRSIDHCGAQSRPNGQSIYSRYTELYYMPRAPAALRNYVVLFVSSTPPPTRTCVIESISL